MNDNAYIITTEFIPQIIIATLLACTLVGIAFASFINGQNG